MSAEDTKKSVKKKHLKIVEKKDIVSEEKPQITRLNYIGSKFQLIDWLLETIKQKTGWHSFENKRVADLFAGTGIISHTFRQQDSIVISNDVERYSYVITHSFTRSQYNTQIKHFIEKMNHELNENKYLNSVGFITRHYSPYNENERMFFTIDNAMRIDYIKSRLQEVLTPAQEEITEINITDDDYKFILASLITSADAVSNVPAVYGCYLKNFKSKALKPLVLKPVHTYTKPANSSNKTYNLDVLSDDLLNNINCDLVYLDPPYNERQYSKNYFPLNIIAKTPTELENEPELKGKTGIPTDCFVSPFCKKGKIIEDAFDKLFKNINTKWLFLSYNSESIIQKDNMIRLMEKYGSVSFVERDYKRFKSFKYNDDKEIKEYLFCLEKK
jgi:adenine-specific DNA-methyltransferase